MIKTTWTSIVEFFTGLFTAPSSGVHNQAMENFLQQATDIYHLEYLEKKWDQMQRSRSF